MSLELFNAGSAALVLFGNCIACKMFASFFRAFNKDKGDEFQKKFRPAQLNEMEYSAVLIAVLLFLKSRGEASSLGSTLVTIGNVGYPWVRGLFGDTPMPVIGYPFFVPFAVMRYFGMLCLAGSLSTAL